MLFNYPAILALAEEINTQAGVLRFIGEAIGAEQRTIATFWEGKASVAYQAWQTEWNNNSEALNKALHQICTILCDNTLMMQTYELNNATIWL